PDAAHVGEDLDLVLGEVALVALDQVPGTRLYQLPVCPLHELADAGERRPSELGVDALELGGMGKVHRTGRRGQNVQDRGPLRELPLGLIVFALRRVDPRLERQALALEPSRRLDARLRNRGDVRRSSARPRLAASVL